MVIEKNSLLASKNSSLNVREINYLLYPFMNLDCFRIEYTRTTFNFETTSHPQN